MNPIESTLQHDWRPFLTELRAVESNEYAKIIIDLVLKQEHAICGPLLTLLPTFRPAILNSVLHVYAEVMNQGLQIVGMTACNWLRLDVKEGEEEPNVRIYSDFNKEVLESFEKGLLG